jgi:predicted RNA-binding protein with PUA-like domain
MAKQYWLMKSEPDEFSFRDLKKVGTESWTGVRNYQARNFMRDHMKVGDEVLFYHSSSKPLGIAGVAVVASKAYPDPTQFDKKSNYYDPKSNEDNPRWMLVDVSYKQEFKKFVSLETLKDQAELKEMLILKKGSRLSITPVSKLEFNWIKKIGNDK